MEEWGKAPHILNFSTGLRLMESFESPWFSSVPSNKWNTTNSFYIL
jgi:hypothetical protein